MQKTLLLRGTERAILALPKRQLRKQTRLKLTALEQALQTCATERDRAEKLNLADLSRLYGACEFCFIYEADITVPLCEMMCAELTWAQLLFGRQLALTLIEGAEHVPQILGKNFRLSLNSVISDDTYLLRLNSIAKGLSNFKRKHEKDLRNIRNAVSAHRDLEARTQLEIIRNMDILAIKSLSTEFLDLLLAFTKLMTQFLLEFTVPNMVMGRVNVKPMLQAISSK